MKSITVELSDETIRLLTALGTPSDVLERLAASAAGGVGKPDAWEREWVVHCFGDAWTETPAEADHAAGQATDRSGRQRKQTDESLRTERNSADAVAEKVADAVVQLARGRADRVVQTARGDADRESQRQPSTTRATSDRERAQADERLEGERSDADAVLEQERVERRLTPTAFGAERTATDKHLTGERAEADTVLVDQREANAHMVSVTIRAQELADELRSVAEFRELFIGILGHDLRNPLGSIGMAAGLLLGRGRLDEQDAWAAGRIVNSAQRMTRLITRLLDLTRARLGGGCRSSRSLPICVTSAATRSRSSRRPSSSRSTAT